MMPEPVFSKERRISSVGPAESPGPIHMRLNCRYIGEANVGESHVVILLCEQFGHRPGLVCGEMSTVGPPDAEFVTCENCLAAMHA